MNMKKYLTLLFIIAISINNAYALEKCTPSDEYLKYTELSEEEKKTQADALKSQAEAAKQKVENEIRLLESKTDDDSKKAKDEAEALLTTINVTFEDNYALLSGAAIYADQSTIESKRDTFRNNYAKYGSAIFLSSSEYSIDGAVFTNDNPIYWSLIYGDTSRISVINSVFENTTSRYATVIYNNYQTLIKKSKFINLFANATAGAIAVKGGNDLNAETATVIHDCEFINVSSAKNAGALFIDIAGDGNYKGGALINNSNFNNCSSDFGGAVLHLGGYINIIDSNFYDDFAYFDGGSVYTSNAETYVAGCNFKNNKAIDEI